MLAAKVRCIQSTSKLRPFAHVPSCPWLRGWDVTPTDYYDRMPPSVRVVLVLLGAWSPNTALQEGTCDNTPQSISLL
jgi:hypothetical protein